MILCDDRIGSGDLADLIAKVSAGPPVEVTRLDFADVAFTGYGPEGELLCGVEVKTINDAVNCLSDGRFAGHQLPGLLEGYDRVYFLVEGQYRANRDTGLLEVPKGRGYDGKTRWLSASHGPRGYTYAGFEGWLTTIEEIGGVAIRHSLNRAETVRVILSLYHWWQKPWAEHKSLKVMHKRPTQPSKNGGVALYNKKPTLVEQVAAQLPRVGWKRAGMVAQRFKTVQEMVLASEDEWLEIEGVGKGIAAAVVRGLTGSGN